jgi:hypothetical protein
VQDAQLWARDFQDHLNITAGIVQDRLAAYMEKLNASRAEEIDAAISKHLNAYFSGPSHAEIVDAAVSRKVDAAVKSRLPDAVQDLLVPKDLPSSAATSFTYDDRGEKCPKLPSLTPAGRTFLPHLRIHLADQFKKLQWEQLQRFKKRISKMYNEVEMAAEDDRVREHGEWQEQREEHTAELLSIQRDTTDDLWREGHKMLEQGQELCEELCEQFGTSLNEQVLGLVEAIDKLNKYSLRKLIAAEVPKLPEQQRRKGILRGFGRRLLLYPDPKLLGRKRVKYSDWEDSDSEDTE